MGNEASKADIYGEDDGDIEVRYRTYRCITNLLACDDYMVKGLIVFQTSWMVLVFLRGGTEPLGGRYDDPIITEKI